MLDKLIQSGDQRSDLIPTSPSPEGSFLSGDLNLIGFLGGVLTSSGFVGFLNDLWSFYAVLAYMASIIFLVLYVYAAVQKNLYVDLQTQKLRDDERLWDELYRGASSQNSRLQSVLTHVDSDNPNDWKLAIIEADIILDDILKQRGFVGNSLGERLKSISSQQLESIQDAWEAHKVRNRIAHASEDFVLTKRIAQETITRYQTVFTELGVT